MQTTLNRRAFITKSATVTTGAAAVGLATAAPLLVADASASPVPEGISPALAAAIAGGTKSAALTAGRASSIKMPSPATPQRFRSGRR